MKIITLCRPSTIIAPATVPGLRAVVCGCAHAHVMVGRSSAPKHHHETLSEVGIHETICDRIGATAEECHQMEE